MRGEPCPPEEEGKPERKKTGEWPKEWKDGKKQRKEKGQLDEREMEGRQSGGQDRVASRKNGRQESEVRGGGKK